MKIRQPNSINIIGFHGATYETVNGFRKILRHSYCGPFSVSPHKLNLKEARKLQDWINRVVLFLEQKENRRDQ